MKNTKNKISAIYETYIFFISKHKYYSEKFSKLLLLIDEKCDQFFMLHQIYTHIHIHQQYSVTKVCEIWGKD